MPPQSWLDAGVYNFGEKKAALAAECCWFAACRQLKYYLRQFDIDVNSHGANSKVIKFLKKTCTDKHLGELLRLNWTTLEREAHVDAHKDESTLEDVLEYLEVAEDFCNYVVEIDQLDFFKKDELLKNLGPHFMSQVLMPDPTEKDIKSEVFDWKSITEWVILGKLSRGKVKRDWIKEGTEAYNDFDTWMDGKCELFLKNKEKQSKN
uniref:HEPN domain-containing protein n=1 Tax=Meloidogyne hapla TaxID=6305 RepID=A0A1I8C2E8_MELHA